MAPLTRRRRQILGRLGGLAAQAQGKGKRWTPEQARAMARKGGRARWRRKESAS